MHVRRPHAFTMSEVLIVIAVLALLIAVAYPSYQNQIHKMRRDDARQSLVRVAQQLERCYTRYRRYNHPDCSVVTAGSTIAARSRSGHYQISSIAIVSGSQTETLAVNGESYTLFARPLDAQASDTTCAVFQYGSTAARAAANAAGDPTTADCW